MRKFLIFGVLAAFTLAPIVAYATEPAPDIGSTPWFVSPEPARPTIPAVVKSIGASPSVVSGTFGTVRLRRG